MKKLIMLSIMLFLTQAKATTLEQQVSTSPIKDNYHTKSTSYQTNNKKVTPVVKSVEVIEAQGSKEVNVISATSVGSLNSKVKSFGCEVPKVEKKVEKPKCDK